MLQEPVGQVMRVETRRYSRPSSSPLRVTGSSTRAVDSVQMEFTGEVVSGQGLAASRMTDTVVGVIQALTGGMRVIPGTLNLLLDQDFDSPGQWTIPASRLGDAWESATGQSVYRISRIEIVGEIPALAIQAKEIDGYPPDRIEVASSIHLRTMLGLE
ncbi:MAG: hypothetical protein DWQ40_08190, partial [Actinobacteria bacterium]